jgi:GTP-binding protein HflX
VVDLTAPHAAEQCQTVESILADLEIADKPRITALNKIDRLLPAGQTWDEPSAIDYLWQQSPPADENTVLISAEKRWGFAKLLETAGRILAENGESPDG